MSYSGGNADNIKIEVFLSIQKNPRIFWNFSHSLLQNSLAKSAVTTSSFQSKCGLRVVAVAIPQLI
jgi:hypothetical protein